MRKILNEGTWSFPTNSTKVKTLFTILKDVKNKSSKYVVDGKVVPDLVMDALYSVLGDDDLFDTLEDTFTPEGVIFDVRDRLKELLKHEQLAKTAYGATLKKFAESGKLAEKKLTEANSTDIVTFCVDDDKLDNLLHDQQKEDLDYKNVHGDSYYTLPRKEFDRFIDYADSHGFDVDYEGSEDSVIEVLDNIPENTSANAGGYNTPKAFSKEGQKSNGAIEASKNAGYTKADVKGKSQVKPSSLTESVDISAVKRIVTAMKKDIDNCTSGKLDPQRCVSNIGELLNLMTNRYLKESLNEIAYKDYKNLDMPNSKKVNLAINDVASSLYQIENFMKQNAKLMKEEGIGMDSYWGSTMQKVLKISERIGNIKKQLKEFGVKEIANKSRQDKIDFIVACNTELKKKDQWREQDLAQLPDNKLEIVLKNRLNMPDLDELSKTYGFKKGIGETKTTKLKEDDSHKNATLIQNSAFSMLEKQFPTSYDKLVKIWEKNSDKIDTDTTSLLNASGTVEQKGKTLAVLFKKKYM